MPRMPREKGEYKVYHVIQRGNERKEIFLDDEDKMRFIDTLSRAKDKYIFNIYGYCLMDNHVHIIIDVMGNDISQIMKSINVSYVIYFNRKYRRIDHLFQDRFKSELVEDDRYLLELSRYIHKNPVKAGMVKNPEDYKWSSYNVYTANTINHFSLVDTALVLGILSGNRDSAIQEYIKYVNDTEFQKLLQDDRNNAFLDIPDGEETARKPSEGEILTFLERELQKEGLQLCDIISKQTPYKEARNKIIRVLRQKSNLTLSEIGKLLGGLSHSTVSKILNRRV